MAAKSKDQHADAEVVACLHPFQKFSIFKAVVQHVRGLLHVTSGVISVERMDIFEKYSGRFVFFIINNTIKHLQTSSKIIKNHLKHVTTCNNM